MKHKNLYSLLVASILLFGCNENNAFHLETPTPLPGSTQTENPGEPQEKPESSDLPGLIDPNNPESAITPAFYDRSVTLKINRGTDKSVVALGDTTPANLEGLVKKYVEFSPIYKYDLLPQANYTIDASALGTTQRADLSLEIKIEIKDYEKLSYGHFLLPIPITIDGKLFTHFISVIKLGDFSPITPSSPKNLPPSAPTVGERKEPMKMIAYVETNDWDIRNYGQFVLTNSRKPVFDFVVLFAANMNWDAKAGKRYIHFNNELQPIIQNPEIYIKPLTDRGIKVLIDILPNHQGVGYANFQSYEEALEFAKEAKMWTDKLGIDGWDIDEEYAEYGRGPDYPYKDQSWLWYARAMKEVMPDKLLTLYDFGHYYTSRVKDDTGKTCVDYIDYTFANYGVTGDSGAGLPKHRHTSNSIEANFILSYSTCQSRARYNVENGYGGLMFFSINEPGKRPSTAQALSGATEVFYGEPCEFVGPYYVGPKGK